MRRYLWTAQVPLYGFNAIWKIAKMLENVKKGLRRGLHYVIIEPLQIDTLLYLQAVRNLRTVS